MYTQCPDCSAAFRVTAAILKQADGMVRCGGCGNAFNALEFLSEQKPGVAAATPAEESLPELQPDPVELDDDAAAESISAEQSAALLKTLDELAGSDIRIEDTGVEWRVVDEDDEEPDADRAAETEEASNSDDAGSIRWFIDDSATPVDEQLSAEPGPIDAPEIFEDSLADAQMRFDDDTPLPEDFDFGVAAASTLEPVIEVRDDPGESEAAQVDLALGDPEDWEDLLDEVDGAETAPIDVVAVPDIHEAAIESPPADDDAVPTDSSTEDEPLPGVDEQFATQAEAMGIDLSGMHARLQEAQDRRDEVIEPAEEETSIDDDLAAAAFETEAAALAERPEDDAAEEFDDESIAAALSEGDKAAEEETSDNKDDEEIESVETETDDVEVSFVADDEIRVFDAKAAEEDVSSVDDQETAADDSNAAEDEAIEEEVEFDLDFDAADLIEARDRELVSSTEEDAKLAAELGLDDEEADEGMTREEPVFLPESEEEKNVNMMIDQDLLAIAVEDDEGFASTIVQKQQDDDEVPETPEDTDIGNKDQLVETIIMEGDFVRDADEEEELERARKKTGDPTLKSAAAADIKKLPEEEEEVARAPVNYGMVAGIVALVLVLAAQGIHQMRDSIVMAPLIGAPLGSLYRAIGRPVTPDWDISGWRFEATKGSTDEDDAVLTIYSRVGNKSAEPLPYPLISVSLTDRYEDIIGSKVLEPGEYLAETFDPRRPVGPGDTFSAVISIESPSAEATGFKLNVCYRQVGGKLKCAIDDFK